MPERLGRRSTIAGNTVEEFVKVMQQPIKTAMRLVGKHFIREYPYRDAYLLEDEHYSGIRDIASIGPELSRPFRALQMWLPLHLHGVAPFRQALDASLDLAEYAHRRLSGIDGLETPWAPDLSIVAFRFDTSELGSTWTEICAYGTAVKVSK